MIARAAIAIAVLVVAFGLVLPRMADYGDAWDSVAAMTAPELLVLAVVALWNLFTYWPVLMLAQPGLRLHEAAVVNQASTAVANTVPAGAAVAVGATFRILRSWGFTTESITNQTVVTGVWNQFVKLCMPILAIAALALTGEVAGSMWQLSAWGLVVFVVAVAGSAVALRAEHSTRRVGEWLDRLASLVVRALGRRRETAIADWLVALRQQLLQLLRARALALSIAALVSHLSLFLVLLTTIRAVGVSAEILDWPTILAGFAFVRLLSAIPVTPGGVGIVEVGYVGFLAESAGDTVSSEIAAAVLVFRAVTYLLPVLLGGIAWIVFQRAGSWRRPAGSRGSLEPRGAVLVP